MRPPNVANSLFVIGLVALVGSFFVPAWSARRVARVERRALQVARALRDVAVERFPLDLGEPGLVERLVDPVRAECARLGQPDSDLPEVVEDVPDDLEGVVLGNRHYLFVLTREPEPARRAPTDTRGGRRPLEVYAWPRTLLPPGRSVFFAPERGRAACSRNLASGYHGLDHPPRPGQARPHPDTAPPADGWYRGRDDERWLYLPERLP